MDARFGRVKFAIFLIALALALALGIVAWVVMVNSPPRPVITNSKDGSELVLIPAGEFWMGSQSGEGEFDEHPRHKVYLDAYYIGKYEVTNEQFARFVNETGYQAQGIWNDYYNTDTADHPVVSVTWNDAVAYCRWAGLRLPTEAEWEKAARGIDESKYPWGYKWNETDERDCNCGSIGTMPVGSFPSGASPYGCLDMAGNVWEWCSDWYDGNYYGSSPRSNPGGGESGSVRVIRGGSWSDEVSNVFRTAARGGSGPVRDKSFGFRVARPLESKVLRPASSRLRRVARAKKPSVITKAKDGSEFILISAGEFWMGSPSGEEHPFENPRHKVYLDAYCIGKYEVTNAQFSAFVKASGYQPQGEWQNCANRYYAFSSKKYPKNPVFNVTWADAAAYCKFYGFRLPTEAEWEKAARGTDGRIYPWGNKWDESRCSNGKSLEHSGQANFNDGRGTFPVGSFPDGASPYGCLDMAGNVREWCSDWFQENYYLNSPSINPKGPASGRRSRLRVIRGGLWSDEGPDAFRAACRSRGSVSDKQDEGNNRSCGFRVARSLPSKELRRILKTNGPPVTTSRPRGVTVTNLPSLITNSKDGSDLVLIPAGKFIMGTQESYTPKYHGFTEIDDKDYFKECPPHQVYLDAYYVGKYEVTNAQFSEFVKESGYLAQGEWSYFKGRCRDYSSMEYPKNPVINVTWADAVAYCRWAGLRLPTEAEWEKSARGTDERLYPWGNKWDGSRCHCYHCYADYGAATPSKMAYIWDGRGTLPVASYPSGASPYGCLDMAGNVAEWCSDWYDDTYYGSSPSSNPQGPRLGISRVIRGGSWRDYDPNSSGDSFINTVVRSARDPAKDYFTIGFRVARDVR